MKDLDSNTDGQLLAAFANDGDQTTFATLVGRHGAMVHGVCSRVLSDRDEARDVAQAVFLTLASQAASLRKDASVGGWLHVVASRLALNARRDRICRLRHEEAAMKEREEAEASPVDTERFREGLDAAISALPEKYRQPLVLFHLEENSLQQTAARLGLNPSTTGNRLARGREMLRKKLIRRGVTVGSVGALIPLLSAEAGAAVLPVTFVSATVQAASLAAAGKLAAGVGTGVVSAKVASLTKGAIQMIFWSHVKTAALVTAACVVVVGGGALVAGTMAPSAGEGPETRETPSTNQPQAAALERRDGIETIPTVMVNAGTSWVVGALRLSRDSGSSPNRARSRWKWHREHPCSNTAPVDRSGGDTPPRLATATANGVRRGYGWTFLLAMPRSPLIFRSQQPPILTFGIASRCAIFRTRSTGV